MARPLERASQGSLKKASPWERDMARAAQEQGSSREPKEWLDGTDFGSKLRGPMTGPGIWRIRRSGKVGAGCGGSARMWSGCNRTEDATSSSGSLSPGSPQLALCAGSQLGRPEGKPEPGSARAPCHGEGLLVHGHLQGRRQWWTRQSVASTRPQSQASCRCQSTGIPVSNATTRPLPGVPASGGRRQWPAPLRSLPVCGGACGICRTASR